MKTNLQAVKTAVCTLAIGTCLAAPGQTNLIITRGPVTNPLPRLTFETPGWFTSEIQYANDVWQPTWQPLTNFDLVDSNTFVDLSATNQTTNNVFTRFYRLQSTRNPRPTITLNTPGDGDMFAAPATLTLSASVIPNGYAITDVVFHSGTNSFLAVASAPNTYTYALTNVPAGRYLLNATVDYSDENTNSIRTPVATVTVTNEAAVVSLAASVIGAFYTAPATLSLSAKVTANGNTITNVQFYNNGTNLLGETDTNLFGLYTFEWANVRAGSYSFTAAAVDDAGNIFTSAVANVTVTNLAAVVALTAPVSGASYTAPATISLSANVTANGNTITEVQFYDNGTNLLGETYTGTSGLYSFNWMNVSAGSYSLTAVAVDNGGNSFPSEVANITVASANIVPNGMVIIPAGSFVMGDSLDGTSLAHTVDVSGFYMDTNLVSYQLWATVQQWATNHGYNWSGQQAGKGPNHPVYNVAWYGAVKWCNARSEMEQAQGLNTKPCYYTDGTKTTLYRSGNIDLTAGAVDWSANGYRLPTEAEWEKAARGGAAGRRFPNANTISEAQANYSGQTYYPYDLGPSGFNIGYSAGSKPYTSPVGAFPPNLFGLYDMAGNVQEWCWDWYALSYYKTSPASDPQGPASGTERMQRGGAWNTYATVLRCADRSNPNAPASGSISTGFRCVRGF